MKFPARHPKNTLWHAAFLRKGMEQPRLGRGKRHGARAPAGPEAGARRGEEGSLFRKLPLPLPLQQPQPLPLPSRGRKRVDTAETQVFGQMVTFESRRGAKVFERFGFRVVEKREITKYRGKHPEPVYLTTVIKQLTNPVPAR